MSQHMNLLLPSFETDQEEDYVEHKTAENGGIGGGRLWKFRGNNEAKEAASVSMT